MADQLVFLTGRLAEERLRATLGELELPKGSWRVVNLGIKVAALMTEKIVRNRLDTPVDAARVIVPGRSRMDLGSLSAHYGVEFVRGPDEVIDLPQYLGHGGKPPDLSKHDVRIFAEIVEAPELSLDGIMARARQHAAAGADVIDIGCQPEADFPLLEDAVAALKAEGLKVSVDSGEVAELRRGALAGADYVLSLDETSLDVVAGTACTPVLVPKPHGDLDSLVRAIEAARERGLAVIADPILDPIHFGFTVSLERYAQLRRRCPDVEILMGTGNLTELTDADSQGLTTLLMGVCSELNIRNVLIVQVSPHTHRTVQEHDAARRLMYRAREDANLPKGYDAGLLSLHALRPFPYTAGEVRDMASQVRDGNYRIEVTEAGIHIYNRDGHQVAVDPFELFEQLGVHGDGGHAFYLGYELAKAETAWRLGKRYAQDQPLDWGIAADTMEEDLSRHADEGATLKAKKKAAADERAAKETGRTRRGKAQGNEPAPQEDDANAADRRDDRDDPLAQR